MSKWVASLKGSLNSDKVKDMLMTSGMELPPGHLKQLFQQYQTVNMHENKEEILNREIENISEHLKQGTYQQ